MNPLHFMVVGAHPDDPENMCGGLALLMRKKGHKVTFVTGTDGSAGHHLMDRASLASRRAKEAEKVSQLYGVEYHILPIPDGELTASLEHRAMLMKVIREGNPDVIITHRVCDYHPDHRACGQLVMDGCYLMGVPLYLPEVPCMRKTPVVLSSWDSFTNPTPFRADVCLRVDEVMDTKIDGVLAHESQYYEWLPWCDHWPEIDAAPTFEEKTRLLKAQEFERFAVIARMYPDRLPEGTGYAEAFECTEYGAPLTDELIAEMTKN